jgi:hypothetical protein
MEVGGRFLLHLSTPSLFHLKVQGFRVHFTANFWQQRCLLVLPAIIGYNVYLYFIVSDLYRDYLDCDIA